MKNRYRSFRHVFLASCAALFVAGAVLAQGIKFNLPEQALEQSLRAVSKSANINILIDRNLVAGRKAPALNGELSADQAIGRLLQGTGLTYRFINENTVVLASAAAPGKGQAITVSLAEESVQGSRTDKADGEVEEMLVEGERERAPFADRNIDLPRGIDDVQPYYIFDAKTIERSGATNIESFLFNRLTMNSSVGTGSQRINGGTNTSAINLRGLGTDHTLILINGRRVAGVSEGVVDKQPDLNGIPLGAIDRIEVLPTSASGIYGGSAMGGVINVILKKEYSGGELRATYHDTWDHAAPDQAVNGTFGATFEGGRTSVLVNAHYSEAKPLMLGDRADFFNSYLQRTIAAGYYGNGASYYPPVGITPNIGIGCCSAQLLTLKVNGASLNSAIATLPPGYSSTSSPTSIIGGQWSLGYGEGSKMPTGRFAYLGNFPRTRSLMATVRRQMTNRIELYFEALETHNQGSGDQNNMPLSFDVPGSLSTNPFSQDVIVNFQSYVAMPYRNESKTRSFTLGTALRLPFDWSGQLDYTWSRNTYDASYTDIDADSLRAAMSTGALNPFVDTIMYPLNFTPYLKPRDFANESNAMSVGLRAAGPALRLPWGNLMLAAALEHRKESRPDNTFANIFPLRPASDLYTTYYAQASTVDNAYLEATVPLVLASNSRPLLKLLEFQAAVRADRYTVDAGTASRSEFPNRTPPVVSYSGPTLNGEPYHSEVDYMSTNKTLGLRYKPLKEVTVRISSAAAFLPPTYAQLIPNPLPNPTPSTVIDPRNRLITPTPANCTTSSGVTRCPVANLTGGNPNLKPQNSKSWNAGIIWEPGQRGLRLNLEYYRIDQFDKIGTLNAQQMVDAEGTYPERITRDPVTGFITFVDRSLVNLTEYDSGGWDFNADYRLNTQVGEFNLHLGASLISYEKRQNTLSSPKLDYAGYVNSGGEGKKKGNATLEWQRHGWALGWTTRYFSSYWQTGAPGDPQGTSTYYTNMQGALSIPAQVYHDAFVSYAFPKNAVEGQGLPARMLSGVKAQLAVTNVTNKYPPFDIMNSSFFYSYYGDVRLRDYTLALTKAF